MKFRVGLSALAIFIFGILFYSFSWNNPFVFDDVIKLQENADLKPGSSIIETLLYPYTQNATNMLRNDPSRPLTFLVYRLCYQIADGKPWPFHVASTLFHSLNAVLVFLLVGLLARKVFSSASLLPGLLAAFFFLLLPINSGTVFYAFAFSDVIAGFFLLSALYVFTSRPQIRALGYVLTLFLFACGLLSKQSAIVLPALIIVTDLLLSQVDRKRIYSYVGFVVIALTYVGLRYSFFGGIGDLEGLGNTFAPMNYLFLQGTMILKYLQLSLVPWGLTLDHGADPASFSAVELTLEWTAIILTTGFSIFFLMKRSSSPAAKTLAWFWIVFLVSLSPTSSFVPTVDLFVERRIYLGSVALAAVFGLLLAHIPQKRLGAVAGGVILALLAIVTWGRNDVYKSPEALWYESASLYPSSKRARVNLAVIYDQQGRYEDAKNIFEAVLRQFPNDYFVHTKVALIYQNPHYQGRNPQRALEAYNKALALNPNDIVTLYNAGLLMVDVGNYDQAEALFRHSLEINPRFTYGLLGLGLTLIKQGKGAEASSELQKSLNIDPNFAPAQDLLRQLKNANPSTR